MALHKTVALSAVAAGIMLSLGAAQATPLLGATEATTIKASDLAAKEKALTDFPLMTSVKSSIQTLPNSEVEKIEPGPIPTDAIAMPYAVNLWQPCLPTLLRKPAATKAGAIFPSGARRWFISVKWAGLKVRKAATTGSVTRISGRGRPGPAVKIKTATT